MTSSAGITCQLCKILKKSNLMMTAVALLLNKYQDLQYIFTASQPLTKVHDNASSWILDPYFSNSFWKS
ncbi:E3 ubiquitin-protein ligase HRD1 [Frankliniella fusca]|uniref:E3 ubiquitin-protein ligase HRD1 n=1 Tax=Frankliniella fusca TaxID=407009 RepID=A0AAE1H1L8_9NEOP|nr:E3 ubiquitin-protein ligase HRD1 [Frankliniella fusca]